MQFPTLIFATFFVITLTCSWAIRRHRLYQKLFLLVASYYFYCAFNWKLLAIIIASSLLNYFVGEAIARAQSLSARRAWMIAGLRYHFRHDKVILRTGYSYSDGMPTVAAGPGYRSKGWYLTADFRL